MMTNHEAISVLESINAKTDYFLINDDARAEAIDIAISALQAQDLQPTCNQLATDTISRTAAIEALLKEVRLVDGYYVENDEVIDKDDAIEAIRLLPSVTPKRKKGKWIEEQRSIKVTLYKCSECGRAVIDDTGYDAAKDFPFCHCGADMRGEQDEQHSV